jgi:hypothetical protein
MTVAAAREQTATGASADEQNRAGEAAPARAASAGTAVGDDQGDIPTTAPPDEAGATTASGLGTDPDPPSSETTRSRDRRTTWRPLV